MPGRRPPLISSAALAERAVVSRSRTSGPGRVSAPAFLPDGVHFLYKATAERGRTVYVGSLAGDEPLPLLEAARALYVQPGFILFTRREMLFAQPFDAERLELTGQPAALVDSVYYARTIDTSAFDASLAGSVAVRRTAERTAAGVYPITVFPDWRDLLDAPDGPLDLAALGSRAGA